uniref:Integrase, catalytic region, zinc finger, CCHC-type, peptidase aspartic, catalytic n=1 Tax=Tanacetum cinerariifolium TaxID=118510 RepID=A0A6L2LBW4_TANCI|nr:integrase, catalytic region, zinc finger, CCHC-type, peptidase aspartic, catalytic [Tanacetum cinerariifolium]
MDLCEPMRVARINGKKYILIIVDDYSRFTWVKFLASKDEAPSFIIKFLKMIQVRLNAAVRDIHIDNGTEFVNQTLRDYYEHVSISHETSIAITPQQNGVVEPQNCTLVKAARIMLIYAKGKLQAKADIGIFIGYAPKNKAYCIYNRCTRKIIETIHVDFDEPTTMASEQSSLELALHEMTHATLSSGLVLNPPHSALFVPPSRHEWDLVFQPVFDEFFSPPASVASPVPVEEAPAPVESTGSPSLTTDDQDAPSLIEPKMYKESCWIKVMQEELHEFERLKVWELVPLPNKVMVITLKWIYKAPYAWYDLLSSFMLSHGFSKGTVDLTLFISKKGKDILQLANIFTKALCRERIEFLIDKLGMRIFTHETLKELADEAEE